MQAHALETQQAPVEAQLVEETEENLWVMAATIDHGADDRGDVTMTVGNQKRRQIPGLRTWIIDSGAMTHVLRLVVAQEYLGILEKSHGVELRGADGHQLDYLLRQL